MSKTLSIEPEYARAADVARMLSIGESTFYALKAQGKIGPMGIRLSDRLVLYDRAEVLDWAACRRPDGTLLNREQWAARKAR